MLDIELWKGDPGQVESLDGRSFIAWLDVWNALGAEFVADKLILLGEEFVAYCLGEHLAIADKDVVGVATPGYEYGRYDLMPRDEYAGDGGLTSYWEVLHCSLDMLWSENPDFLLRVLGRCIFVRSIHNEDVSENNVADRLHLDMAWEREQRRAGEGFASSEDASAFLLASRDRSLDELMIQVSYDLLTARHFRVQRQRDMPATDDRINVEKPGEAGTVDDAVSEVEEPMSADDVAEVESALKGLGVMEEPQPAVRQLLTNGKRGQTPLLLDRVMQDLANTSPLMSQQRLDEIVYLANILMAGTELAGQTFSEANAVKAVRATCNLGLEFIRREDALQDDECHCELLSVEPGLIRPFHVGYSLLTTIPGMGADAVKVVLASNGLKRKLNRTPWIGAQLESILPGDGLIEAVTQGDFTAVQSDVEALSMVLEAVSVQVLRVVLSGFPMFPRVLDGSEPILRVDKSVRFVRSLNDLERITAYLQALVVET